jgi:hypothetical protein
MRKSYFFVLTMVMFFVSWLFATPLMGLSVTLNDIGLMSLDWYAPGSVKNAVIDRRNTPGPGVEFDIHFPGIEPGQRSASCVSSKWGGSGLLIGTDISMYDNFQLKFTLVSVDSISKMGVGGVLGVGAIINFDSSHGYQPKGIDLLSSTPYTASAISSTHTDAERISIIGFVAYIPPSMEAGWNPLGTTVTLWVQAAPGAVAIPEPFTVLMLGIGSLCLLRNRRGH